MISWCDLYKVVSAMVPLYVALGLGYGSVRWWKIFTPEQCDAINRLVALFTIPFFTFDFTVRTNPYTMNYRFIAADAMSKIVIILALVAWAKLYKKGSYAWSLTCFSLSTLNNTLVVGVPLVMAMYGKWAQDLVVQLSVVQSIIWNATLLFGLELRKALNNVGTMKETQVKDVEAMVESDSKISLLPLMKVVWLKLVRNPNVYASVLGITWSLIANRWHIEMPTVVEGSILIISKAGAGTAMFSMGLFMALQEKTIACGPSLTVLGMVLRFIVGPAVTTLGAFMIGLRGNVLRLAIIQAALPQSIASFIFAKEYGLHAEVLSTAVIFGTLVSLPVLIGYFIVIGFI
ncbi:hypothetical protein LUZ61_017740 [Rhynchospora tenuis]|uniref:Auxin efflux carrier component n=1 Tax=Rhynchospora tenuis TaxID=198213 RepID=A0AAD6ELB7_9POAL|nr:hypothetical protein LUZ61_017740 [Rhynchospora tenuis]